MISKDNFEKADACIMCNDPKTSARTACCYSSAGFKTGLFGKDTASWACGDKVFNHMALGSTPSYLPVPSEANICAAIGMTGGSKTSFPAGKKCGPKDCTDACSVSAGEAVLKEKEACKGEIEKIKKSLPTKISAVAAMEKLMAEKLPKQSKDMKVSTCKDYASQAISKVFP